VRAYSKADSFHLLFYIPAELSPHNSLGCPRRNKSGPTFPFAWTGGVITALNADEQREIAARRHRCALCGESKQLTHKKISGGVPTFICNECAEDYVQRAQRIQARHEPPKKLLIEVSAPELATVTFNGIAEDLKRLVDDYLEEEGFADDANIRLIRSE
jgi:hypothetical protein